MVDHDVSVVCIRISFSILYRKWQIIDVGSKKKKKPKLILVEPPVEDEAVLMFLPIRHMSASNRSQLRQA